MPPIHSETFSLLQWIEKKHLCLVLPSYKKEILRIYKNKKEIAKSLMACNQMTNGDCINKEKRLEADRFYLCAKQSILILHSGSKIQFSTEDIFQDHIADVMRALA